MPLRLPLLSVANDLSLHQAGDILQLKIKHRPGEKFKLEFHHFDGRSWRKSNQAQRLKSVTAKSTQAVTVIQNFRIRQAGKWRVRSKVNAPGARWSPWLAFAVKPFPKLPVARRKPVKLKTSKTIAHKSKPSAAHKPSRLSAPALANLSAGQKFTTASPIAFQVKPTLRYRHFKVKYALYHNACRGKAFKVSGNGNFGKLPAGRYCVKATYLGGKQPHWSKGIPFVVEKRRRIIFFLKKRVASPKKIKIQ